MVGAAVVERVGSAGPGTPSLSRGVGHGPEQGTVRDGRNGVEGAAKGRSVRPAVDLRCEADLEAAYRAHAGELARFAARYLRDHAAAHDVVQETFVRAWRSADSYDPAVAGLRVWLFSIARNVVIDHVHRSRRPTTGTPTAPEDLGAFDTGRTAGASSADGFSEDLVTGWMLEQALTALSPEQRAAIVETHLRGRSHDDVAAEQAIALGTLRSRIFYGLKNLRRIMDEQGVTL